MILAVVKDSLLSAFYIFAPQKEQLKLEISTLGLYAWLVWGGFLHVCF